jgi:POT family proton-dependent oligopeptide transporter
VGNYTGIAIATFIAGNVFYYIFRKRDSHEEEENAIGKVKEVSDTPDSATLSDESTMKA